MRRWLNNTGDATIGVISLVRGADWEAARGSKSARCERRQPARSRAPVQDSLTAMARRLMPAALGLLAMVTVGCGPAYGEAYMLSFRAGQRAHNAGRYDEAAEQFAAAAKKAQRIKDRDEALFMQARMYEKGQRHGRATPVYHSIAKADPPGPRRARAEYEIADLEIDHGDKATGYALLKKAFRRWPDHGMAKHALHRWVIFTYAKHGEATLRQQLQSWLKELPKTDAAQQLKYELGLSWLREKNYAAAERQLLIAAREHPYPLGSLTDDAYMWASKAAEKRGDFTAAVVYLDELQRIREASEGGSYNRPMYPHAQMRKALLLRDQVKDIAAAIKAFQEMYGRYPNSAMADDAMWHEARLALAQNRPGDACNLAERLRDREPKSRYRRCLPQLCAKLKHPKGTRYCPDYLKRELRGEKGSDVSSAMREGVATSHDDGGRSIAGELLFEDPDGGTPTKDTPTKNTPTKNDSGGE